MTRVISGESCSEVFDALTLVAALSVDPLVAEPAALARDDHARPSSAQVPSAAATATRAPPPSASTGRWRAAFGAHIGVMSAHAASTLELFEPFAELSRQGFASPFMPALRLGFSTAAVDSAGSAQGFARLRWTARRNTPTRGAHRATLGFRVALTASSRSAAQRNGRRDAARLAGARAQTT